MIDCVCTFVKFAPNLSQVVVVFLYNIRGQHKLKYMYCMTHYSLLCTHYNVYQLNPQVHQINLLSLNLYFISDNHK